MEHCCQLDDIDMRWQHKQNQSNEVLDWFCHCKIINIKICALWLSWVITGSQYVTHIKDMTMYIIVELIQSVFNQTPSHIEIDSNMIHDCKCSFHMSEDF